MEFVPVTAHPLAMVPPPVPGADAPDASAAPLASSTSASAKVAVAPDPTLAGAVRNGAGPALQPGNGQAARFAAGHAVGPGRDWDFASAQGLLETAKASAARVKAIATGAEKLDALERAIDTEVQAALDRAPSGDKLSPILVGAYAPLMRTLGELRKARSALASGMPDGVGGKSDPREGLSDVRKTLRVFRYEMQLALAACGLKGGEMERMEKGMRGLQNFFTSGFNRNVTPEGVRMVLDLESLLAVQLAEVNGLVGELNSDAKPVAEPPGLRLADSIPGALDLSHRTNDRIRAFEDADASTARLRGLVGPLAEKGGSHSVELSVGIGALGGLGFAPEVAAGLRAGARVRVVGEIRCPGKGQPIAVTFRIAGGLEASAFVRAGNEAGPLSGQANVSDGGEISHFTTRSYATVDDLILDAKSADCWVATRGTIGGMAGGAAKTIGQELGTKFFRWLGTRSDEVKQDYAAFLDTLRELGVAGECDRFLAARANPVIVAESSGGTLRGQYGIGTSLSIGPGVLDVEIGSNNAREMDFRVVSRSFATAAFAVAMAPDAAALAAMMLPGPAGGAAPPPPDYADANAAADAFDALVEDAKRLDSRRDDAGVRIWRRPEEAEWAEVANGIRSAMIGVEAAARAGRIPRAEANRLLVRFSNPSVRFPRDVFREYLMEGTGAARPAKIRDSSSFTAKASLLKGLTDGLAAAAGAATDTAGDAFHGALAAGGIAEARHQLGLDASIQYRFSAESPLRPGEDPRPWENVVRTTHELVFSASAPARILIDSIARTALRGGERIDGSPDPHAAATVAKAVAGDLGSDALTATLIAVAPGLVTAAAEESARAVVADWLSNERHARVLVAFVSLGGDESLATLAKIVEWAARYNSDDLAAAKEAIGSFMSAAPVADAAVDATASTMVSTNASERLRTLRWSFADEQLESFAVSAETLVRMGFRYDFAPSGFGFSGDASYTVRDSLRDYGSYPNPPLTTLLAATEGFLFAETGLEPAGNGEALKNWLSRNVAGLRRAIRAFDQQPAAGILRAAAGRAAAAGPALANELDDALRGVRGLAPDAPGDAVVEASRRLLVALVQAFRA